VDTEDGQGGIYYTEDGSDPTFTKQPQKLTPGETLIIKANRIIKFVVADEKGNYSPIKLVEAINELEKHRIVRAAQPTPFDESVTFYFPKSKHAAEITFSSLVQEILRSELLSTDDLIKIISLLSKE